MSTIFVSGAIANKPLSGGEAWVRMSWVRGLQRLGFDVCFVEQIDERACVDGGGRPVPFEQSINRWTFDSVLAELAPCCSAALICDGGRATVGLTFGEVVERARDAELLVNISGHLDLEPVKSGPRRRAYIDVDPGFTQVWASGGAGARLEGHDAYFSVGERIGQPGCSIPTNGLDWRPLPPPVMLDDWPVTPPVLPHRFTTVATWRSSLGGLSLGDVTYPGKHHEWRRVIDLPRRSPHEYEIALDIHAGDFRDREALDDNGWRLQDPRAVAGDPLAFRAYVQGSSAEFSVAHGAYVDMASGWVSDRSVRYLASGRPALVQDTGIAARYSAGEGLVTFRTVAEAAKAASRITSNYAAHAAAAREIAETHFDSDRVLGRFLEEIGVS